MEREPVPLSQSRFGARPRARRDPGTPRHGHGFPAAHQPAAVSVHGGDGQPGLPAVPEPLMAEPKPLPMSSYRALRAARHETVRIRGLDTHLRSWGPEPRADEPRWLLLHGYQDTGDTFQFLVDAFERDWPLTALDWRGFGSSEWGQNGYWFQDYLADLDALLEVLCGDSPVRLVGHSMGGNIASLYAGVRPRRVRSLVNLEGFGMPRTAPDQAPAQLVKWLNQVKAIPPLTDYDSFHQLASIIRFRYPRFGEAGAEFVARAWGRLAADGRVHLL